MEVEKIAPMTSSPLDASRGRGKRVPRYNSTSFHRKDISIGESPTKSVIVQVILEPRHSVGVSNGK